MCKVRVRHAIAVAVLIVSAGCGPALALSSPIAADSGETTRPGQDTTTEDKKRPSAQEKMQARFPQPAQVKHLIGLPVLDDQDSTIGYVQQVFKTPDGQVKLVVPYGKRFGWVRNDTWLASGRRPVAVPIEAVVVLALQINAIDMDRSAFAGAPTWMPGGSVPLHPEDTVMIGLGRR